MNRRIVLTLIFIAGCLQLLAVPPLRRPLVHKQPDGTRLTLFREHADDFIFYTTTDGLTLLRDDSGTFRYASLLGGTLKPTGPVAHDPAQRSAGEQRYAETRAVKSQEAFDALSVEAHRRLPRRAFTPTGSHGQGIYGQTGPGVVNSIGTHRIPVLMVEFADKTFQPTTTPELLTRIFNEEGYTDAYGSVGSVADYFREASRGLFSPTFDVVGKVILDSSYVYYGQDRGTSIDPNILQLYAHALTKAFAQDIDFTPYIEADRGGVPLICFYYAGQSEANSFEAGSEDYIWPQFRAQSATFIANDSLHTPIRFNSYFVGNEIAYDYTQLEDKTLVTTGDPRIDGQGTFIHEFSHALGLPDFYRTSGSDNAVRMGSRSIMDYGMYFKDGYAPVAYTAYERNVMGWERLTELTEAGTYTLTSLASGGNESFVVYNDKNRNEYYILENCQRSTFYPVGFGHGLFVMHVDYDATAWRYNRPNNDSSHLRMTFIPADGARTDKYKLQAQKEFKGDPFPGTSQVDSLTDNSSPRAEVYTGTSMRKPLYNITETGTTISFDYLLTPQLYADRRAAIATALQERTDVVFGLSAANMAQAQAQFNAAESYTDIFNLYNFIDDSRRPLTTGYYRLVNAATGNALAATAEGLPTCTTAEAAATSDLGTIIYILYSDANDVARISAQGLSLAALSAGTSPAFGEAALFSIARCSGSKAQIRSGALLSDAGGTLEATASTAASTDAQRWYLVPATQADITLTNAGDITMRALYLPFSITLPEGVKAYVLTTNSETEPYTFTPLAANVPSATPLLLIDENANASLSLSIPTATPEAVSSANLLQGTFLPQPAANALRLTWSHGLPALMPAVGLPANSSFIAQ
ncbi:MAG: M6 family metalloprotease domain-containing protein [Alloprevotella sp.]|nr:M6 family metalloprotease domain-containing protein [Alloprevotella sp.]